MKIYEIGPGGRISIPPKAFGAIERVIYQLYRELSSFGHEVEIVNRPDVENVAFDEGAFVHCHWAGHALKLQAMGVPYAYTSHSHIWQKTCQRAIMGCEVYLPLHEGMVPAEYRGPIVPVGNGVDVAFWHENRLRSERQEIVVACAHYHKRKRLEMTHDLIELLPEPWRAIIVGPAVPGHVPEHPRIELMGEKTPEYLRDLFSRCRVGFHPAQEEAYALVPMQMAACKLLTFVHSDCFVYPKSFPMLEFDDDLEWVAGKIKHLYNMGFNNENIYDPAICAMSWANVVGRVQKGIDGWGKR